MEDDELIDPSHISLCGFLGVIIQARFFTNLTEKFFGLWSIIIDIIKYRETFGYTAVFRFMNRFWVVYIREKDFIRRDIDFDSVKIT